MRSAVQCSACGTWRLKENSAIGRARRSGLPMYCDKACAGVARRLAVPRSAAELKEAKRLYDADRRERLADRLKAEKAAHHKRTYDPAAARIVRAARMPYHVEYCRRPEYRARKADYDREHLAKQQFGPFWEAAIITRELEAEVATRIGRVEISRQNGTLNKKQSRRRDYDRQIVSR